MYHRAYRGSYFNSMNAYLFMGTGFSTGMVLPCDKPFRVMTLDLLLCPDSTTRSPSYGFHWISVQEGVLMYCVLDTVLDTYIRYGLDELPSVSQDLIAWSAPLSRAILINLGSFDTTDILGRS
jgi:hypothetical protein